ncbi:MAG: hypothetical protein ACI39W_04155 [Brotaphodocola sp.]
MKKKQAVLAVLGILAGMMVSGCGQQTREWKANENSIYVDRARQVQSALVYTSERDNELYDEKELAAFAEQAIEEGLSDLAGNGEITVLNEELQKNPPVSLVSCKLDGKTGTLVFHYASADHYGKFAELTGDNTNDIRNLMVVNASDEKAAEVLVETGVVKANGKAAEVSDVTKHEDYVAVVFEGSGTVCTEGKIVYISADDNVTLRDDFTAVTGEGKHCIIFK